MERKEPNIGILAEGPREVRLYASGNAASTMQVPHYDKRKMW